MSLIENPEAAHELANFVYERARKKALSEIEKKVGVLRALVRALTDSDFDDSEDPDSLRKLWLSKNFNPESRHYKRVSNELDAAIKLLLLAGYTITFADAKQRIDEKIQA